MRVRPCVNPAITNEYFLIEKLASTSRDKMTNTNILKALKTISTLINEKSYE